MFKKDFKLLYMVYIISDLFLLGSDCMVGVGEGCASIGDCDGSGFVGVDAGYVFSRGGGCDPVDPVIIKILNHLAVS